MATLQRSREAKLPTATVRATQVSRLSTGKHFLAFVAGPPRVVMMGPQDALLLKVLDVEHGDLDRTAERVESLVSASFDARRRIEKLAEAGVLHIEPAPAS